MKSKWKGGFKSKDLSTTIYLSTKSIIQIFSPLSSLSKSQNNFYLYINFSIVSQIVSQSIRDTNQGSGAYGNANKLIKKKKET